MKDKLEVLIEDPLSNQQSSKGAQASWLHTLRSAVQTVHFQSALQLTAGIFAACLFTFVRPIAFLQACIVPTLFCVVSVMSSPNNHLGTRINAAASLAGSMWPGALAAAAVTSISKLAGNQAAATAVQCALGCVVIAVLAINRVASSPPMLWALGMNSCLAFGMVTISSWRFQAISQVWQIAGAVELAAVIAACISVLVAALVAPTLASEQVQVIISDVLLGAGIAASRYGARLFRPEGSSCGCGGTAAVGKPAVGKPVAAPAGDASSVTAVAHGYDDAASDYPAAAAAGTATSPFAAAAAAEPAGSQWQQQQQQQQQPGSKLEGVPPDYPMLGANGSPDFGRRESLYGLGEVGAALLTHESLTEEQWLQLLQINSDPNPKPNPRAYVCPMPQAHVGALRPRLAEAQMLLPSAAVEPPWVRGVGCCGSQACWFEPGAWGKVIQCLLLLITRLSALEAVIEDGESLNEAQQAFSPQLLARLRLAYSQTATSLALMAQAVKTYGQPQSNTVNAPAADSKDAGVAASGPFCGMVATFGRSWGEAKADLAVYMQQCQEQHWASVLAAAGGSKTILPTLTKVRHLMYTWSLTNGIIDTLDALEKAVAAAVCSTPPPGLLQRAFGWVPPLLPLLGGVYLAKNWALVLGQQLPAVVRQGHAGFHQLISSRIFQAGVKYWLVLCLVLVATLLSLHFDASLVSLNPSFGYVAASLAMSERVEATVTKVCFWILGTLGGGALGFLSMMHPATATNPYALMTIMVAAAAAVGLLGPTRARVAITLTLMTLTALVLCQCCGGVGRVEMAAARVVAVIAGVLTSVVVCNMLLPWYTSDWAIQTMADTYYDAVRLMAQLYVRCYEEGAAAVASFELCCPAPDSGSSNQQGPAGQQQESAAAATADADAGTAAGSNNSSGAEGAHRCISYSPAETAAAAQIAAALAAAVAAAFPDRHGSSSSGGGGGSVDVVSPAVLQARVAGPLIAVQSSLIKDTVAWKRGVLATPQVVPRLLSTMLALLDRLAALQLSMAPPTITGRFTGLQFLHYGVPLRDDLVGMFELLGLLVSAVAAALQQPSCVHANAVNMLIKAIEQRRLALYTKTQQARSAMHQQLLEQHQVIAGTFNQAVADMCTQLKQQQGQGQGQSPQQSPLTSSKQLVLLLGGADDAVRFLGFQFAIIKAVDKATAAAKVAVADVCQLRNTARCTLR